MFNCDLILIILEFEKTYFNTTLYHLQPQVTLVYNFSALGSRALEVNKL